MLISQQWHDRWLANRTALSAMPAARRPWNTCVCAGCAVSAPLFGQQQRSNILLCGVPSFMS
ncbi:Unknown protein sequence [Pseudomonas syringae pv. syringae]|nr:Unknown protein sequence [Pseudomonas syringae pv. syringae]